MDEMYTLENSLKIVDHHCPCCMIMIDAVYTIEKLFYCHESSFIVLYDHDGYYTIMILYVL